MFSRARTCGSSKRSRTEFTQRARHLGGVEAGQRLGGVEGADPRLHERVQLGAAREALGALWKLARQIAACPWPAARRSNIRSLVHAIAIQRPSRAR